MNTSELLQQGLPTIAEAVRSGKSSAAALLDQQFELIDAREPNLQVYITQTRERAAAQAASLDRRRNDGESLGTLAGVPLAVKDIFEMSGTPTTAAMTIHRERIASEDATVIRRLESAGATILGKLTLTEGVYAEHRPAFPVPVNPWSAAHWPGASSSGTGVAVAAGLCCAGLGSETGGSIKLPAAANGVTALKPTWGRVSRHGVFELAASLDHVGPFARSAADAALLLQVIAGADEHDPTASQVPVDDYSAGLAQGARGIRIGVDHAWLSEDVDLQTRKALDAALDVLIGAGADVVDVTVPDVSDMIWDWFPVCAAQTALAHRETFPSQREAYGEALAQLLDQGNELSAVAYQEVLLRRESFRGRMNTLLESVDMLALPVLSFPVPTLERMANIDDELIAGLHRFTCPFNLSGHPGLVLPCGSNDEGLPIVFQLVGRHFDEARLLAAGGAYQDETDWHRRQPNS